MLVLDGIGVGQQCPEGLGQRCRGLLELEYDRSVVLIGRAAGEQSQAEANKRKRHEPSVSAGWLHIGHSPFISDENEAQSHYGVCTRTSARETLKRDQGWYEFRKLASP
jgi:hypothetical protein